MGAVAEAGDRPGRGRAGSAVTGERLAARAARVGLAARTVPEQLTDQQYWQLVEDFFSSTPTDRVFTINRNSGLITLGDGDHGRIALINPANTTSNVIARWYRAGVVPLAEDERSRRPMRAVERLPEDRPPPVRDVELLLERLVRCSRAERVRAGAADR